MAADKRTKRLLHFFWFDYQRREHDAETYENSNSEIQKWAERILEKRFTVHNTSCVTQGRVTTSREDILLGLYTWDPGHSKAARFGKSQRNWVFDNRLEHDALSHPNTYMLTPWVPAFPPDWTAFMPFYESQLEAARLIFAICGPIWYEQTLELDATSVQGRVKDKLVRLNMAVNYDALKIRKSSFNPMGERKLIHVSNLGSYKGFDLLLQSTEGVAVPTIGSKGFANIDKGRQQIDLSGTLYAINNVGAVDNSNDQQIHDLVRDHDFYIHTASMDAQATTVLEFGARGLIPIVTPESGFDSEDAIYLTRSASENKEIIDDALHMPEDELRHRSERIKTKIRTEHSWPAFYDTIAQKIDETCQG